MPNFCWHITSRYWNMLVLQSTIFLFKELELNIGFLPIKEVYMNIEFNFTSENWKMIYIFKEFSKTDFQSILLFWFECY